MIRHATNEPVNQVSACLHTNYNSAWLFQITQTHPANSSLLQHSHYNAGEEAFQNLVRSSGSKDEAAKAKKTLHRSIDSMTDFLYRGEFAQTSISTL